MARHSDDALVAALCRQSKAVLTSLGIQGELTLTQLHERMERLRRRTIHLIPYDLPPLAPHGLWVAGERADYIFYDRDAPPVRQQQIIAHEYGHMVFDHRGIVTDVGERADAVPQHSGAVGTPKTCRRTVYEDLREQRAELFGTVVVGSTMRSWQPRPGPGRLWSCVRACRAWYQLRPLWRSLHSVVPEVALLPQYSGVSAYRSAVRQAMLRWIRLPVEILDGFALLAPWASQRAAAVARCRASAVGLRGDRLAMVVDAAVIAAALSARQRGDARGTDGGVALCSAPSAASHGPASVTAHVAWLVQLGRALRHSPLVSATVAEVNPVSTQPESLQPTQTAIHGGR